MYWRRITAGSLLACAASVASMLVVPPPALARPLRRPAAAAAAAARFDALRLLITETDSRVVALGDVHGDYRALCAALVAAGLLDVETGGWCGGDTVLVQLGDILDRGDSESECWELMQRLKEEARASGGGVVCLIGNHEVMNVAGRAAPFLHPRGHACFGADRAAAWRQGGPLASALADCPAIAIVGDSAFVHAHLPAGTTRDSMRRLNDEMRDWLLDPRACPPRWIWGGEQSPVWDRSLSVPSDGEPSASACAALRASLQALGVSRVVVGHTPQAHTPYP